MVRICASRFSRAAIVALSSGLASCNSSLSLFISLSLTWHVRDSTQANADWHRQGWRQRTTSSAARHSLRTHRVASAASSWDLAHTARHLQQHSHLACALLEIGHPCRPTRLSHQTHVHVGGDQEEMADDRVRGGCAMSIHHEKAEARRRSNKGAHHSITWASDWQDCHGTATVL